MKRIIIFTVLLSLVNLHSQDNIDKEKVGIVILNDVIVFVPAVITFIGVHEIGHYSMAKVFGADDVKFGLFRRKINGGLQIGWTQLNGNISTFGHSVFSFGGVLFTRGFAEISNAVVNSDLLPTSVNRYFSMTYILGRFDISRYVFQDALLNMFGKRGSDIDALVTDIAGESTGIRTLTYVSMLALSVLELVFNWEGIERHWSILTGKEFKGSKQVSKLKFGISKNSNGDINILFLLNI